MLKTPAEQGREWLSGEQRDNGVDDTAWQYRVLEGAAGVAIEYLVLVVTNNGTGVMARPALQRAWRAINRLHNGKKMLETTGCPLVALPDAAPWPSCYWTNE